MTVEKVIEAVEIACMGFKRNEQLAFKRYFLKYFFPCFSHARIANMTNNCDHSSVQKNLKRISGFEYTRIRERVLSRVIVETKRPCYHWVNPKQ